MCNAVFTLLFLLLVPVIAYVKLRSEMAAFFVSAPLGMLALVAFMVHTEANALDGDIDIIFEIGCILWALILAGLYAACFLVVFGVRRLFSRDMVKAMTDRRWFQFSLRTFLLCLTLLGGALACVAYHVHWIRERQAIVSRGDIIAKQGSFFLEPPPIAPWQLRPFDNRAFRSVTLVIVDQQRALSDHEMYVESDDLRLTEGEREQLKHVANYFPEARAYAWFRKTRP